ncbi:MAG TPA: two-component regulator propeller domain-containing protein [Chitinophagaceae bacterium]|nr:two-component regulator propeller domain-containing protein [Chitinophagaceae bacterium]
MYRQFLLNIARWKIILLLFFVQANSFFPAKSQTTSFNFRRLTNTEGLSDGIVRAFVQDKYGFIWIGTSYGLNRFDGINIKNYFSSPADPGSLGDSYVLSLYTDSKNNLWIGTFRGLCRYDYSSNKFVNYVAPKAIAINDIREDNKGRIWLAATDGLWIVDEQKLSVQKPSLNNDKELQKKFECLIGQIITSPGGDWYFATNQGIKIFNPITNVYSEIKHEPVNKFSISSDIIYSIALDSSGHLWAACITPKPILNKIDLQDHTVKLYDYFISTSKNWINNVIRNIMTDKKGHLWVTSSYSGLSLYDEKKDNFKDYRNDPFIPNSLLSNQNISIYQGRDGIIWLGTPGYGLSYFNPEKNFFSTVYPFLDVNASVTDTWCRAACEDQEGNRWLATGKGVAKYDSNWQLLATFTNNNEKKPVIHYNSVRSLLLDDMGDMWIGTAKGLNRYHPSTGAMDFFDQKQGIPLSFFWMMVKDKNGEDWMGSAHGLFRYMRKEDRFDDLRNDPVLSKYAHHNIQALYADSRDRLWIGILDIGLVIYDVDQQKQKLLTVKDSLISDTRFSSFAEDKDGIIWIGSENGLTAYDPVKNRSRFFTRENGLPSNRTNNIMVDSLNRIWIGTSNGLCMLNTTRDKFKRFDVNDGLLTNQFNEQSAYRTKDGSFIYPTYKGFLVFRPEDYRENISNVPVYITSFKISDKEITANTEDLQQIHLRYNENFFSIELAGLNYMNPFQCVYAYQLEPFDKNWIYTRKREINYTNVPAGNYTFRYKVITDNPDWNVPEKTIRVSISEIFYKTWWFRSLVILILIAGLVAFYRYRVSHRERILVLQNKAQLLEKEKTSVMYENLKQHLNPHFLFNSLTSLSSLIRLDQQSAGDFLDKMSKVYRYILKNRDNETVPLSEELKFVELYIQLQKTRFEKGLQVHINIDEEYQNRRIAPVTLQNLVENAIKHNIADTDTPLIIDLFIEDDYLVVRNNLQKKKFVETSNKQGLVNMLSLYRYLGRRPMVIEENSQYFIVKIPLI